MGGRGIEPHSRVALLFSSGFVTEASCRQRIVDVATNNKMCFECFFNGLLHSVLKMTSIYGTSRNENTIFAVFRAVL